MLSPTTVTHAQYVLARLPYSFIGGFVITILYYKFERLAQNRFPHLLGDNYELIVGEVMMTALYDKERAPSGYLPHFVAMVVAIAVGVSLELITLPLIALGYFLIMYITGIVIDPNSTFAMMIILSSFVAVAAYFEVESQVRMSRTYLGY